MSRMNDIHPMQQASELQLLGAVVQLQHLTTPASVRPIPMVRGTTEQRYIAIGTPAEVARLLEIAPATPSSDDVRNAAIEQVAKLIDKKVYAYQDECGSYDHTTGVTEYPGKGAEWICEMEELAEEIRALKSAATQSVGEKGQDSEAGVVKPLARCAAARDGECRHAQCPQLRDNEPDTSGRHCPLDNHNNED